MNASMVLSPGMTRAHVCQEAVGQKLHDILTAPVLFSSLSPSQSDAF